MRLDCDRAPRDDRFPHETGGGVEPAVATRRRDKLDLARARRPHSVPPPAPVASTAARTVCCG
jgi:hypothetical protein